MKIALLLTVALAAIPSISAATVTLSNQGFEGGLSSWNTTGNVQSRGQTSVVTYNNLLWEVSPRGSQMAALNSNGASAINLDQFFGLPGGTLQGLNPIGALTNGAGIYQDFFAFAGDVVTMSWNYVARDYVPFNDPAFAVLISPSGYTAERLASIYDGGWTVGTAGSSGWRSLSYTITDTGTHRLGFGLTNDRDTILDAALFLDDGAGEIVTTPGVTPVFPVLPDSSPCPSCFEFNNPAPGLWFDPPYATSYTYTLFGAEFTQFSAPPASFGFGDLLFTDLAGANASFVAAPGKLYNISATGKFMLSGIPKGKIDAQSPDFTQAFPAFLNWTGVATKLSIDAGFDVPEPSTYALVAAAIGAFVIRKRR